MQETILGEPFKNYKQKIVNFLNTTPKDDPLYSKIEITFRELVRIERVYWNARCDELKEQLSVIKNRCL